MTSGPEHYREAERLLDSVAGVAAGTQQLPAGADGRSAATGLGVVVAKAQVHATLALTAATALPTLERYYDMADDAEQWLLLDVLIRRPGPRGNRDGAVT